MEKKEYLENIKTNLSKLNDEDRKRIVRSYRVKINTLINQGNSMEEVIKKLGTPSKIASKIYKENGIVEAKKKKDKKVKDVKVTKKVEPKVKKEKKVKKTKEKKNKVNLKEKASSILDNSKKRISSLNEKKEQRKKESSLKKESKKKEEVKVKEEKVEKKVEVKKEVKPKKEVKKEVEKEIVEVSSDPKTVVIKQMLNFALLIVCLGLLYFPFNLVSTYIEKLAVSLFANKIGNIFMLVIWIFYLAICIYAFIYYLNYISNNTKLKKVYVLSEKIRKIILLIIEIPFMLVTLAFFSLFLITCFFYLDGLKIKGLPIAFFGLFIFMLVIYMTIKDKINGKTKSLYYSFVSYLVPLLIVAFGFGISYVDIKDVNYISDVSSKYSMKFIETEYSLPENEKFRINFNTNYHTAYTAVEDKKLNNKVRVEVTYYKDYYNYLEQHDSTSVYISLNVPVRRKISLFLENMKDNEIYNSYELERYEVKIYYNPKDANRIVVEN